MNIRKASSSDIKNIKHVMDGSEIQALRTRKYDFTSLIKFAIKSERYLVLTAEEKNKFVGFSLSVLNATQPRCAYILAIGIIPQSRDRGYGGKLLKESLKQLKEKKQVWVYLLSSKNKKNLNFYKKQGFKIGKEFIWCEKNL